MTHLNVLAYGYPPLFALVIMGIILISYGVSIAAAIVAGVKHFKGRPSSAASKVSLAFGSIPLLCFVLVIFAPDSGYFYREPTVISLATLLVFAIVASLRFLNLSGIGKRAPETDSANKSRHSIPDRTESK